MDYTLEQRLNAFVGGQSGERAFIAELCAVCDATPDLAWDVLALTDQYHRRGKISADVNRAIRYAIVRPALTRQTVGCADVRPVLPVVSVVPVVHVVAPDEVQALRCEVNALYRKLLRNRTRLAKVIALGRGHRDALVEVRRGLNSPVVRTLASFVPGPPAALDIAPAAGAVSSGTDRKGPRLESKWVRPSQFAAAITLFLTVTASSALREAPIASVAPPMAAPAKEDFALAAPEVQRLSLVNERYVVRPGASQALIQVRRAGGSTGMVSFTWWTRPSGAKSGADYRGQLPALEQLPEGADTLTLSVPIISNPLRTHTEYFYVEIGHPSGGAVIGEIRTSVVIIMPGIQRLARLAHRAPLALTAP